MPTSCKTRLCPSCVSRRARALPGAVVAWTGAGDELTRHPHVHILTTEGVFLPSGDFYGDLDWDSDRLTALVRDSVLASFTRLEGKGPGSRALAHGDERGNSRRGKRQYPEGVVSGASILPDCAGSRDSAGCPSPYRTRVWRRKMSCRPLVSPATRLVAIDWKAA